MKHIVNFSGGACSFWAAKRVIAKFGTEHTILLFADTLEEDEDLYAFNSWAEHQLGMSITRICDGRTIWGLFKEQGCIGNSLHPICSVMLKRNPLDAWRATNCLEMDTVLYLGFDASEFHRVDNMRKQNPTWKIEAPMCDAPLWDKCRIISETAKLGAPRQKLYDLGFPHNNCGGCCVRAGISHWVHLLKVLPQRFLKWEKEESEAVAELVARGISPLSILKDRRGGVTKNMYLKDLRLRVESGEKLPLHDWGGCGCGGATGVVA